MVLSLRRFKTHFGSRNSLNYLEDETKLAKILTESSPTLNDFKIISHIDTTIVTGQIKSSTRPHNDAQAQIKLYHSKHNTTDHPVVIKSVRLDSSSNTNHDPHSIEDNYYEIKMLKSLKHVNILPLLASFVDDNDLYIVMSAAQYGSLDMWRYPVGISEAAIALVMKDVLTALIYLHKQGIVHRAICGSHILINSNGNCLLTGLKYSISMMNNGRLQSFISDFPNFSPKLLNICAPEVLRQNMQGYNTKSDIYSLGILCCELANGCVPFDEIESTEMFLDKMTGSFPRPLDSNCEEIKTFVTENLTKEQLEKYNAYKNRTFTQAFLQFTMQQCLLNEFPDRPTAAELMNSAFIKQATKKSGRKLLELLQNGPSSNRMPINNNPSSNPSSSHSSKESIIFEPKPATVDLDFDWTW